MGLFKDTNPYSTKYITAEIKDVSKRLWFREIKYTVGDYFLTDLGGQTYCFKMDNEICQHRERFKKTFRVYQYDIKHYRPMKSEIKELEFLIKENNLPKVNVMLSDILRILGRREKSKKFTPHILMDLIKKYTKDGKANPHDLVMKDPKYAEQLEQIAIYLNNMDIKEIVTPVRGISEFIEDDLKATDPKFLGTVATTLQNLDFENKKVMNVATSQKILWMKWALIFAIILVIIIFILYGIEKGWFKAFTEIGKGFQGIQLPTPGSFAPPGVVVKDSKYYQDNYTPEELKAAIDRGEIDPTTLPEDIKKMAETVELPTVTP